MNQSINQRMNERTNESINQSISFIWQIKQTDNTTYPSIYSRINDKNNTSKS